MWVRVYGGAAGMGIRLRMSLTPGTRLSWLQPSSAPHAPTQPADECAPLAEDERDAPQGDGDDDDDNATASAHAHTGTSSVHPPSGAGLTSAHCEAAEEMNRERAALEARIVPVARSDGPPDRITPS